MPFDFDMDSISPVESGGGSGGETITATNVSSAAISSGEKVWVNEEDGEYSIIDFATTPTANFTIHGSPTINNKVVSGFSSSNYLTLEPFKPENKSWEILFKIKVPSHQPVNFVNWFSVSSSDSGRWGVSFGLSNDKMYAMMSSNGSSWDLDFPGITSLSTNTDYWIKLEYDTTKYIMSYSTDGVNYTVDTTLNNSTPVYNNMNNALIGGYNIFLGGDNTPFNGTLDLSESYIKIDGEYWWVPYSPVISESSFTGKAVNNIGIGGTGSVEIGKAPTGTISITENGTYDVANYASADVNVGGGSANITSLNVTPTTSAQTITASGGVDGYSPVNVSAVTSSIDANITAGNIKDGVTILGVTGNYTGGGVSSEVACYVVQNGTASKRTTLTADSFSNITTIGNRALRYAYYQHPFEYNTILNMSNVISIGQQGMEYSFYGASGIVSIDLSSLTTVGSSGLAHAFDSIGSLAAIDLSSLTTVGSGGLSSVCANCDSLSSVDLSSVQSIGTDGLNDAFNSCDIRSVSFDGLSSIGESGLIGAFAYNYNLSSVSFLALTSNSFESGYDNFFEDMLDSCENVTVHFPSNLQSVIGNWTDVINGFSGTNTTVLFDLPATE